LKNKSSKISYYGIFAQWSGEVSSILEDASTVKKFRRAHPNPDIEVTDVIGWLDEWASDGDTILEIWVTAPSKDVVKKWVFSMAKSRPIKVNIYNLDAERAEKEKREEEDYDGGGIGFLWDDSDDRWN
jgi:hypothetical protein